jgi:Na+-driven multidrug efflux pump
MIKERTRDLFVIHHSLRNFIVAAVLSSIMEIINTTIDGIVVSQAVSADAISVVTLVDPVLTVVQIFGAMLFAGAALIVASAYGNQQYKTVNRLVTMSMTAVLVLNGLLAIVCCLFSEQIAHLLTDEERLLPMVADYMPFSLGACVAWLVCDAVGRYVEISGRPKLVTNYVVLNTALNAVLDVVMVVWWDMGMRGAAIASLIAPIVAIVVFIPYLTKPPKPFAIDFGSRKEYCGLLRQSMGRGVPTAVGALIMAVLYMALNYIVLESQGADGMYILSVCLQTVTFGLILAYAADSAVKYIGGVMYGERDWDGLNRLQMSALQIVISASVVVTVLVYLHPSVMAEIYGADERLCQLSEEPIRLFVQSLIPLSVLMLVSNAYMMSSRSRMASLIEFGPLVIMLPVVWFIANVMPDYFWYSIPLGLWMLLLITIGIIYVKSRRGKHLHWLFLTPTGSRQGAFAVTIWFNNEEDTKKKLLMIQDHISSLNLSPTTLANVQECMEELILQELEMGKASGRTGAFDVSMLNLQQRLTVIVKDVGKAYSPQLKHHCEDINYQYQNGLNCLYLNFPVHSLGEG